MPVSVFCSRPLTRNTPPTIRAATGALALRVPTVCKLFVLLRLTIHQTIAHQNAVGRGSRRCFFPDFELQFVGDAPGSPASMVAAHLADQRFDIGRNPAWAGMRATRLISQSVQAAALIAFTPRHAVTVCRVTPYRSATSPTAGSALRVALVEVGVIGAASVWALQQHHRDWHPPTQPVGRLRTSSLGVGSRAVSRRCPALGCCACMLPPAGTEALRANRPTAPPPRADRRRLLCRRVTARRSRRKGWPPSPQRFCEQKATQLIERRAPSGAHRDNCASTNIPTPESS